MQGPGVAAPSVVGHGLPDSAFEAFGFGFDLIKEGLSVLCRAGFIAQSLRAFKRAAEPRGFGFQQLP